ncbi:unnamed protein product [Oppiella nova]|uniref:Uncharacterized protein n=1 Tax=Oppiella nova TaxID=334625 RepID=A0A7R9QT25_9ACAR|nr:unnamed protein product [Oppiella nova]CAG2173927.1 unnamed protein product [Oppiella nova]
MPTLLDAIGVPIEPIDNIYGTSQWLVLANNTTPVRRHLIHNIDPIYNMSAIRWHDWKLVHSSLPLVFLALFRESSHESRLSGSNCYD